jgi:multicomponent Na+:H+ antiporter subunit D
MSMSLAIAVPIIGSLVAGVWPTMSSWASQAAHRFTDITSYTAAATGGVGRASTTAAHGWATSEVVLALAIALASIAVAAAAVRLTVTGPLRPLAAVARPVTDMLHRAHTGHIGDYVVWMFAGLATLTLLLRLQVG